MANTIKAKVRSSSNIKAGSVSIGSSFNLEDIKNIDMSLREQGAMLVYDEELGIWKAKQTLEDGTNIEGGHY